MVGNVKSDQSHPQSGKSEDLQPVYSANLDWRLTGHSKVWRPPTDVFETEDAIIVRIEIAGMREDDFTIGLDRRQLVIRGVRQDNSERRAYHQMEIRFGEFGVELEIPAHVDPDNVEAVYSDGFLRIRLPKAHPKRISIGA